MANEQGVNFLSEKDLDFCQSELERILRLEGRLPAKEFYQRINSKLETKVTEAQFCQCIGAKIACGRLSPFHCRKGRKGGIYPGLAVKSEETIEEQISSNDEQISSEPERVNLPEESNSVPEKEIPVVEPKRQINKSYMSWGNKPKEPEKNILYSEKESFMMEIDGESMKVPCNDAYVRALLTMAFQAVEDESGTIKFFGKSYSLDEDKRQLLQRVLLVFCNAAIIRGLRG